MLHETNVPPEMELKSKIEINWKLSRARFNRSIVFRYSAIGINWFNLTRLQLYLDRNQQPGNKNLSQDRENGENRSRTIFHGEIRECWQGDITRRNLRRDRSAGGWDEAHLDSLRARFEARGVSDSKPRWAEILAAASLVSRDVINAGVYVSLHAFIVFVCMYVQASMPVISAE